MTLLGSLGEGWATVVLPWALESSLVAALLLLLLRLGRHGSPPLRVALATLGLLKLALPPALLPAGLVSLGVTDGGGGVGALGSPLGGAWLGVVAAIHLAGAAAAAAGLTRRWIRLQKLCAEAVTLRDGPIVEAAEEIAARLGLARRPRLLVSERSSVPFVTGLLRPTVVVPAWVAESGSRAEIRSLLGHEISHLRRGDLWLAWLRAVAVTLWWPSPLARRLASELEAAAEERCDDTVLDRGLASEPVYARALLVAAAAALEQPAPEPLPAAVRAGARPLERRIRRLADRRPAGPRRPGLGRRLGLGVPAVLLLAALTIPTFASGRLSPGGWTTRVLFFHPAATDGRPDPSHGPYAVHQHRHEHRLDHPLDHPLEH